MSFGKHNPNNGYKGLVSPTIPKNTILTPNTSSATNITNLTGSNQSNIGIFPPSISRTSPASTWGIGGFTTPPQPNYPPSLSQTIASTLGNPQMPSVYLNSRAPMGFNFRMAGSSFQHYCKRKPEDDFNELPHAKQHITEEKVSAHLNSLHISEQYRDHKLGRDLYTKRAASSSQADDDPEWLDLSESSKNEPPTPANSPPTPDITDPPRPRLVISDAVNKIIPGERQLPESLLKKLMKPKMEVVLWQPPGDIIRNIIKKTTITNKSDKENSPTSTSHNCTSSNGFKEESQETPMDLPDRTLSNSNGSSPDSGVSLSSPSSPPSQLSFLGRGGSSNNQTLDHYVSLPSTSGLGRNQTSWLPRPASPTPEPMMDDDLGDRMEFNNNTTMDNNNGGAISYLWMEENNNSALIDLNVLERSHLDDLPDLPDDDDDMDL